MGINPVNVANTLDLNQGLQTISSAFYNKFENNNENIIQVGGKGMYNKDSIEFKGEETIKDKDILRNKNSVENNNQTTLLISNIPQELNSIDQLSSHFKKFGTIINIKVYHITNNKILLIYFY